MIQLRIQGLPGAKLTPETYPWMIGRHSFIHHNVPLGGIFDHHLEIHLADEKEWRARTIGGSLATLNGVPFSQTVLKPGDQLGLGSLHLVFEYQPLAQTSGRLPGLVFWALVLGVTAVQAALFLVLLRLG